MASGQDRAVALLPIQPRFVEAILSGRKRVEFRKRPFKRPVEYVVIYASRPIRQVVGFFRVSVIEEGAPTDLWERFGHIGGIDEEGFTQYYLGVARAFAIGIDDVETLETPMELASLRPDLTAPQSFAYLSPETFDVIRTRSRRSDDCLSQRPG